MQDIIQQSGNGITWEWLLSVVFIPFLVYAYKKLTGMIEAHRKEFNEHKTHSIATYATKDDLKEVDNKHTIAGKETREYVRDEVSRSEHNILREISSHKESTNKIISLIERLINNKE